jgi:hypothetical protein
MKKSVLLLLIIALVGCVPQLPFLKSAPVDTPVSLETSTPTDTSYPTLMPDDTLTPTLSPTALEHETIPPTATTTPTITPTSTLIPTVDVMGGLATIRAGLPAVTPSVRAIQMPSRPTTDIGTLATRPAPQGGPTWTPPPPVYVPITTSQGTDSGGQPIPTPDTDAEITEYTWAPSPAGDYIHVDGIVKNTSEKTLNFVTIYAAFRDQNGNLLKIDSGYADVTELLPGQESTWSIVTQNPGDVHIVEMQNVTWSP